VRARKQHRQSWAQFSQALRQGSATDAGHDDIGDDGVELLPALPNSRSPVVPDPTLGDRSRALVSRRSRQAGPGRRGQPFNHPTPPHPPPRGTDRWPRGRTLTTPPNPSYLRRRTRKFLSLGEGNSYPLRDGPESAKVQLPAGPRTTSREDS
jgi:hypothetical protein